MGAALIFADRRINRSINTTKLIGAFHDYTKAPKTYTTRNVLLRNIGARSRNHCWRGKAIIIKHHELCVYILAFALRHANNIFSAYSNILSSVACTAVPHFTVLPHKWLNFLKNVIYHKICVMIFSTTLVWNISHSEKNWARYYYKLP